MSHDRKHKARYLGPFQVKKRVPTGQYIIAELDGTLLPKKIVPWRLMPYIHRNNPTNDSASDDTDDASSEEETDSD